MSANDYITVAEAARRLNRSRALLYRWVEQGRIKATRIAGHPFIRDRDCRLPEFLPPGPKPKP